jgi:hypothetical protein
VAASSITLGGMLEHLAYVEDSWCSRSLHGRDTARRVGHLGAGRLTPSGTGTRPPRTHRSSSRRCGRTPLPAPALWSPRRWPTAALERLARRTGPSNALPPVTFPRRAPSTQ